jgi:hypothetical protein
VLPGPGVGFPPPAHGNATAPAVRPRRQPVFSRRAAPFFGMEESQVQNLVQKNQEPVIV